MSFIVTAFFLIGTLEGINVGIDNVIKLTSVSHLIVQSRVNQGQAMPLAHKVQIESVPGVTAVAPFTVVIGTYQRPSNPMIVIATDFDAMLKISTDLMVAPDQAAALRRTRNGAIVGVTTMKQYGWKVGDRIPLRGIAPKADGSNDWQFDIVGTYTLQQPDWATRIFANYDFVNEALATGKNQSVLFYVGISDPAKSAAISQAIDDRFANSPDQTNTANEKDSHPDHTSGQIGNYSFLINGVCAAVLFTLLFLTANTIGQSVRERTSELAVLKTLGFTDAGVQWLVLAEALTLGNGGGGPRCGAVLPGAALDHFRPDAVRAGHRCHARAQSGVCRCGRSGTAPCTHQRGATRGARAAPEHRHGLVRTLGAVQ